MVLNEYFYIFQKMKEHFFKFSIVFFTNSYEKNEVQIDVGTVKGH